MKIFQILLKLKIFELDKTFKYWKKKLKEVPMLGFEHPSHMVTHPSTDEAQCCLSLEIFVNSAKKKKERKKMKVGSRVPSELRGLIIYCRPRRKIIFVSDATSSSQSEKS